MTDLRTQGAISGRRFRRVTAAAALGPGAVLAVLAVGYGADVPAWSIPLLVAAVLVLLELVTLAFGSAQDAVIERRAVNALLMGRLLVGAALAFAAATVALLAAAAPARHGPAVGLLGAAAAAAAFLLVASLARRSSEAGDPTAGRLGRRIASPGRRIQPGRETPPTP